jgi:hypothetical protein
MGLIKLHLDEADVVINNATRQDANSQDIGQVNLANCRFRLLIDNLEESLAELIAVRDAHPSEDKEIPAQDINSLDPINPISGMRGYMYAKVYINRLVSFERTPSEIRLAIIVVEKAIADLKAKKPMLEAKTAVIDLPSSPPQEYVEA